MSLTPFTDKPKNLNITHLLVSVASRKGNHVPAPIQREAHPLRVNPSLTSSYSRQQASVSNCAPQQQAELSEKRDRGPIVQSLPQSSMATSPPVASNEGTPNESLNRIEPQELNDSQYTSVPQFSVQASAFSSTLDENVPTEELIRVLNARLRRQNQQWDAEESPPVYHDS